MIAQTKDNLTKWLKVSELAIGMQIAVPRAEATVCHGGELADDSLLEAGEGDIKWDEIAEIKAVGEERVYDIEVSGTHNFVAGHLIDCESGEKLSEEAEAEYLAMAQEDKGAGSTKENIGAGTAGKAKLRSAAGCWFGAIYAHNTYISGNLGVGTSSPYSKLAVVDETSSLKDVFTISTSTSGLIFKVDSYGRTYADGAYTSPAADYAEYFYTQYINLEPGETVCLDLLEKNAVKRCYRGHDNNVMGIVSSKPSILGNFTAAVKNDPAHYAIVGMLGQVDALVSTENGPIAVGDSLTSASSTPGYAMRADGGDSTVGVALEPFGTNPPNPLYQGGSQKGKIKVLISRRNKSFAVEEVEQLVVERIAAMKIEDQVQAMIKQSVDNLNLDPKIAAIAREEAGKLDSVLTARLDETSGIITNYELRITNLSGQIFNLENQMLSLRSAMLQHDSLIASSTAINENIKIDESGRMVIGRNSEPPLTPLDKGGEEEGGVEIVEVTEITASSSQTTFVVNQQGEGEVADFQARGVSIMNIDNQGQVKIVGSLLVDGRIMLCAGGYCSNALDAAVDETQADLGVEGKVVAGAFEGWCEEGYSWAPGSAKYGTLPGFCVMRDVAGKPESVLDAPSVQDAQSWTNVSQGEAQYACQSLGAGYHLLSENEWLTLAENILQVKDNPPSPLYQEGAASSTALKLTNDNAINNLSGSVAEWTSQNVTAAGLPVAPARDQWFEYGEVVDFKGLMNIAPDYYLTDANNHIGKIYIGSKPGLKGFVRGQGGIYGLDLSHSPAEKNENIGFRCAK